MKIKFLLLTVFFLSIYQAQVKFGAKSGVGIFFNFFDYNILAPKINDAPKTSLYGNPIPGSKNTLYLGLSHQHEIFATYHNQIFKFAVAFSSADRPYNDPL